MKKPTEYESVGEIVSIFQRGGSWHANFQLDGKQHRRSLRTTSKKQARRQALLLEADILEGRFRQHQKPALLASVANEYLTFLRSENRATKTLTKYSKVVDRLLDLAQRRRISSIDQVNLKMMDEYRRERVEAGASPKTVYTETVIIRQLVNFALSRGSVPTDPLKGLKIREPKPTAQPCWTRDEVERILAASSGPQRWAFELLADTGMRIGELKHLTWDDVDFPNNSIHVRPKDDWRPKTGDMRAIPMSQRIRELFASLPRRHRWVLTAAPSPRYPQGGQRMSERRLLVALKCVLKKLGLKGHLHTFRHAFISWSLTSGTPEAMVRRWVGHVDREVLDHYTHIASSESQDAMRRLSAAQSDRKESKQEASPDGGKEAGTTSAQIQHTPRSDRNG
jgi:integrase